MFVKKSKTRNHLAAECQGNRSVYISVLLWTGSTFLAIKYAMCHHAFLVLADFCFFIVVWEFTYAMAWAWGLFWIIDVAGIFLFKRYWYDKINDFNFFQCFCAVNRYLIYIYHCLSQNFTFEQSVVPLALCNMFWNFIVYVVWPK